MLYANMDDREDLEKLFKQRRIIIAIYITHRVKIAKNATKIIVIDEGKIVGMGNHMELLKSCSVYNELYKQEVEEYRKKIL